MGIHRAGAGAAAHGPVHCAHRREEERRKREVARKTIPLRVDPHYRSHKAPAYRANVEKVGIKRKKGSNGESWPGSLGTIHSRRALRQLVAKCTSTVSRYGFASR